MSSPDSAAFENPAVPRSDSARRYRSILACAVSGIFSKGISLLVSIAIVPLTVRYLGPEGYGLWTTISSALAMFFIFDIGIANSLMNRISEAYAADDRSSAAAAFATALWMVIAISFVLGLIGWSLWPSLPWESLFHSRSPEFARLTSPSVAAAFIVFLFALPAGLSVRVLGGYQEAHAANIFAAIGNLLSLLAVIAVIYMHGTLPLLVAGYAGAVPLAQVISMIWIAGFHKPWLKPWPSRFRRAMMKGIFHTGTQFFLIQIAGLIVFNSDNLVIAHYLSPAQVTPYNVTWRMMSYFTAVQVLFVPALWPAYSEAYTKRDYSWIRSAYDRNRWITIAVLAGGSVVLLLAGRHIIAIWAGMDAVPSRLLLRLMCVWMFIFAITVNQSCLMGATSRMGRQPIYGFVAAVVNLGLSIIWVRRWGTVGVISATILSYLMFAVVPQAIQVRRILSEGDHSD